MNQKITDERNAGGARSRTISSDGEVNESEVDTARVELELPHHAGGPDRGNFYFHIIKTIQIGLLLFAIKKAGQAVQIDLPGLVAVSMFICISF